MTSHRIDYNNQWKNSLYISTYDTTVSPFDWKTHHSVCILNELTNEILYTYSLPKTRICLGVITLPDKNLYIYIHYKYIDSEEDPADTPSLVIDFYRIDELSYTFTQEKNYTISSEYSCGNINGKVCRMGGLFCVGFGDINNYNYIDIVSFDENTYLPVKRIENIENIENISSYYYMNSVAIKALVIAYDNQYLNLGLLRINEELPFISAISKIQLPFTHRYDKIIEIEDVNIIELCYRKDSELLCLLRIKLENNNFEVNLEIEEYYVDILFDIISNKVKFISNKISVDSYINSSVDFTSPSIWSKNMTTITY